MLSRNYPFEYPVKVMVGDIVECNFKVKGRDVRGGGINREEINDSLKGKRIWICIHLHYKTDLLGRGTSTNVLSSDTKNILLDDSLDSNYSVELTIPEGKGEGGDGKGDDLNRRVTKSVLYMTTDSIDSINGIEISEVTYMVKGTVKGMGTFVGGKTKDGTGFTDNDPLVPGLGNPSLQQHGIIGLGNSIDTVKEAIKKKYDSGGGIDVVCEGLMLGHSGFAKAMRNVTYGLENAGKGSIHIRTNILDWDTIGAKNTDIGRRIVALKGNQIGIGGGGSGLGGGGSGLGGGGSGGVRPGAFYITMNFPLGVRAHPGYYNIGYIMYETVGYPQAFIQHLKNIGYNSGGEIWTPSGFCKNAMVANGLDGKSIHVMPLGVDTTMFSRKNADEPRYIPGNLGGPLAGKFKFLTVMGYSERKGVSILIRAFIEEFIDCHDVALYFKGGWYSHDKAINEINAMISDIPVGRRPYIAYDFNIYPDDVLVSLYKGCDAFVLASRGEGFGEPLAEAMSMGMPTIGTNWSGNLEFMNSENSYLINVEGFAEEPRCDWITHYYRGQKFAIPSKSHLRQLMRYVYEHREEAKKKGLIARDWMIKNFDWKVSCARMKKRLEDIARG